MLSIRITYLKAPSFWVRSQAEAGKPVRRLVHSLGKRQPRDSDPGLQCGREGSGTDHV